MSRIRNLDAVDFDARRREDVVKHHPEPAGCSHTLVLPLARSNLDYDLSVSNGLGHLCKGKV